MQSNYKKDARDIARQYVRELEKHRVPVSEAYVFGSYVGGRPKKDSDIDVCIVSPYIVKNWWKRTQRLWNLRQNIDLRIEPHIFSPREFSSGNPFVEQIKKQGVRIAVNERKK